MLQYTKNKWFRISAAILLLVGLYALAGFWLAPKLLRSVLLQDIPKAIDARPSVGEIHVNPFLMQVEVKDFALADSGGVKLLGFQRLFIDFQLSSLWHRAYTFSNIDVAQPFVSAVISEAGQLNLAKLVPKANPAKPKQPEKEDKSGIPALRIDSFKVDDGSVSFADDSHVTDFHARLEPLNFELKNFTTGVDGGRFTFTASSKLGEKIEWHGHLSVQPVLESDGEFQIDGLKLHTAWEYLEDKLNFVVNSGTVNVNSTYRFSFRDGADLHVDVQRLAIDDLTVRARNGAEDWIKLPQFAVSNTSIDLLKKQVTVEAIALDGLKVTGWLEPDGSVNLMTLAAVPRPVGEGGVAPLPSCPPPPALPATSPAPRLTATTPAAAPWRVELRRFALKDASLSVEDRSVKPVTKLLINPLSLTVDGASLDLKKPVDVSLDARINQTGSLHASGKVVPDPVTADLKVTLADLDLAVAQPYIGQKTSMTLLSGSLSGATQVHYGATRPTLTISGDVGLSKLHTVDNALHADFVNWDKLDVQQISFSHDPDRLDVGQITGRKMYARVIIEPDTSLNVTRVLSGPGATVVVAGAQGTTAPPTAVTAAPPPGRKQPAKPAGPPPMPLNVKRIVIENSEANFSDLSITPNFTAGIQKLAGNIDGLSTVGNKPAKIDLKGQVDPFSPVTIKGEVNALSDQLFTDIALNFSNISLATFNPYSGKFAGYNISKGKLTTDLHYKIDGRKLDAQHHITIDQLEFGEKTDSKDAVSLPIKLAVSLLKDRNGVIDLDVPVTGSLDDPQFKLGPIIWKVFFNIVEKAVTAPFALLGRLFGGGPDLQFIDFEPGHADLDATAAEKAASIGKALNERPQLKIEVPVAVVKDVDGPALIDEQIRQAIEQIQAGARKKLAATPYDQLEPGARVEILAQIYKKAFGSDVRYPDEFSAVKGKNEQANAKVDFLMQELRATLTVSDADLTQLATKRAQALQAALLMDSQIAPERLFLANSGKVKAEGGKVRLELSLQ